MMPEPSLSKLVRQNSSAPTGNSGVSSNFGNGNVTSVSIAENLLEEPEPTKYEKFIKNLRQFKRDLLLFYWKPAIYVIIGFCCLCIGIFLTAMHFILEVDIEKEHKDNQTIDMATKPYFISGPIATSSGIIGENFSTVCISPSKTCDIKSLKLIDT